jgi:signal peptidase I
VTDDESRHRAAGPTETSDEPLDGEPRGSEPTGAEPADAPRSQRDAVLAARRASAARAPGQPTTEPGGGKPTRGSSLGRVGVVAREVAIVVVIALIASALLRAFVVQAFFVPSGSMLPTIKLHDRILVSRIGGISRGEVVVFEDPGNWIPASEQPPPPNGFRKALEFLGVLPASGHEHLVKRVIGLPGDHVVCCRNNHLVINGVQVDESGFIKPGKHRADNVTFNVVVPKDRLFVLGDNRYVSGDSSRHLNEGQQAFVPESLVTGRAFAVIWPYGDIKWLSVPDAYDKVPDGETPRPRGVIKPDGGTSTR